MAGSLRTQSPCLIHRPGKNVKNAVVRLQAASSLPGFVADQRPVYAVK